MYPALYGGGGGGGGSGGGSGTQHPAEDGHPSLLVCATADRKGVCRVAVSFVTKLLSALLRSCQRKRRVHAIVGCDNAPALNYADGLRRLSPQCRSRLQMDLDRSRRRDVAQIAIMVR